MSSVKCRSAILGHSTCHFTGEVYLIAKITAKEAVLIAFAIQRFCFRSSAPPGRLNIFTNKNNSPKKNNSPDKTIST